MKYLPVVLLVVAGCASAPEESRPSLTSDNPNPTANVAEERIEVLDADFAAYLGEYTLPQVVTKDTAEDVGEKLKEKGDAQRDLARRYDVLVKSDDDEVYMTALWRLTQMNLNLACEFTMFRFPENDRLQKAWDEHLDDIVEPLMVDVKGRLTMLRLRPSSPKAVAAGDILDGWSTSSVETCEASRQYWESPSL